jgi:Gpi18-like mannosyltransferase
MSRRRIRESDGSRPRTGYGRSRPAAALRTLSTHRAFLAVAAVSVAARLVLIPRRGFAGDVRLLVSWAERIAATGPAHFYDTPTEANYPAALYLLWPLGSLFDGETLRVMIKAISLPFDLAIGALIYGIARRWFRPAKAAFAAGLYLLNPGTLIAGVYFGQIDAVGTLGFLVAAIATADGAYAIAGFSAAMGALVKPQFALAGTIVTVAALRELSRRGRALPALLALGGVVLATVAVTFPLQLSVADVSETISSSAARQPYVSVNAINLWGLVFGFGHRDGMLFYVGAIGFVVVLVMLLWRLRERTDLIATLAIASLVSIAFFYVPTRIHERYLFPALALLPPIAPARWPLLLGYLVISGAFSYNLVFVLWSNGSLNFLDSVRNIVFTREALVIAGVAMLAGSLGAAWQLKSLLDNPGALAEPRDDPARVQQKSSW